MSFKKFFVCLMISGWALQSEAAQLVILTDEASGLAASRLEKLIRATYPFKLLKSSEFNIKIKIINESQSKDLSCAPKKIKYTDSELHSLVYHSKLAGVTMSEADIKKYRDGYTIDRLIECDSAELGILGGREGADHMIFIKQSHHEGGSGGNIPVILSGSRPGIGLHEWLHSFGLADEYPYASHEAPFYCTQKWVNVAIFNALPPYRDSDDVRIRHSQNIPWLPYLSRHAKLVSGDKLGSPQKGNLGIFKSDTCRNVSPQLESWKSSSHPTIMENPFTNYIPKPYWSAILSGLGISAERSEMLLKTEVKPETIPNF